ncbi:helix-turn-helix transcriptional regulator [Blastococcus sp. TML/M2B]|uniref:helix-turn-helix domain-containing protein n=1 Tax=unclassified Blastococcus TaxID=2619396 RepID=UPI00190A2DE0|nr:MULTISPECIES: helix-turn-helix domain-containing protein [unclassified Blastococcus]MBN1091937.1 helix-turn-helix transcriptional regulator [Blastococcus sp. TML/M2B]MBN1097961.1 helix-turn-helix transcriptional regulator [Blastococcus sp. TML/C7B]
MAPTPPPEPAIDVRDVRALRALAHPLRMSLLAALRSDGPSTASRLAERLGESSGATSYHLRQLAGFGFVEEVPGEGTGRERWWRALHRSTRWNSEELLAEPGGREVVDELTDRLVAQQRRMLAAFAANREQDDDEWRATASLNDWALRLSPARARELVGELNAVVQRWRDEHEEPGQPLVRLLLDLFPLEEQPL